jgi:O-glycosyl hydrolase
MLETTMKKIAVPVILAGVLAICNAYGDPDGPPDPVNEPTITKADIDPAATYQEMIGFGGSLTWYSDRITSSPQKDQICKLLLEDLGTDIIRFKNNYYPQGYPAVKSPATMENGTFVYEAFGEYWNDLLDNLQFNPDYISIKNEPGWITPDRETCEWRPTETADFPGYDAAFDAVYNRISTRADPTKMIGPEAENIGYSNKLGGNTFARFSDPLRDKSSLAAYVYHTYNFPSSVLIARTKADLNMIRGNYGNKPCIMTEFSNFTWLNTAWFINQNLNEANAAGYIYWLMAWADSNNDSMIRLTSAGAYTLTPFYYVMKHFAKEIDSGYVRIKVLSPLIPMSGFIDPAGRKITVVAVNPNADAVNYEFEVTGKIVKSIQAVQTDAVNSYKETQPDGTRKYIILKPKSVTIVVLELQ